MATHTQVYSRPRIRAALGIIAATMASIIISIRPTPVGTDGLGDKPTMNGHTTTTVTSAAFLPTAAKNCCGTGEWTQLAGNPQRTAYIAEDLPTPWRVKWIWNGPAGGGDAGPTRDHIKLPKGVQPIAGGGRVYIGQNDGTVRALSDVGGSQVWSTTIGGQIVNTGAYDPDTGTVYFGSTNGRLYRLRASDGYILGSFYATGKIVNAPLLVGSRIYVGTTGGRLYAIDKHTLAQYWLYDAGAAIWASPAFSSHNGGLVIIQVEDKSVHAIRISNGLRHWRVPVNADVNPDEPPGNASFVDTYPVVSDANGVVIVRSFLAYSKMDMIPTESTMSTAAQIRTYLTNNPDLQSLFVLDLNTGAQAYVAPVLVGGIGNGHLESVAPQVVVKCLPDGSEVAYLWWRNGQVSANTPDDRQDTTLGEMNLADGNIRFVQSYRNEGSIRVPTDEQSPLSMVGDTILHAHWMTLGAIRLTDRSTSLGNTYTNPIRTLELAPVLNTLDAGTCARRDSNQRYCPVSMSAPGDSYQNAPGFYVYYHSARVYDLYWTTPVRSAVISHNTVYWKTVDGAIIALGP